MAAVKDLDLRWNDEVTVNFVRLYLRHEWLWNPKHKDHKNQRKRQASYLLLVADCEPHVPGITSERVKQKIKVLRTMYCQELRRKIAGRVQSLRTSNWFTEMDHCLRNVTVHKKTSRNRSQTDYQLAADSWQDREQNIKETTSGVSQFTRNNQTTTKNEFCNEIDHFSNLINIKNHRSDDSFVDNEENKSVLSTSAIANNLMENREPVKQKSDEFDVFCLDIARQLRNLSPANVIKAQVDIQNILTFARLSQM